MEIVHVIRQYAPSVGGLEDSVYNLCQHLSRAQNVKVRVVTLNRVFTAPDTALPAEEIIDGVRITRISYFGSKRYPIAFGILKAIKGADIVHVHAIDWFFDFLAWTKPLHRIPLIASTHGGFFHTQFAAKLKKIYFQTITRISCHAYTTICASSENDATTFRKVAGNKVITIENGVNIEKWQDSGSKTLERKLIFVGRWSANKRIRMLLELLGELRKLNSEWELYICGIQGDDTLRSLQDLASKFDIAEAVHIFERPSEIQIKEQIRNVSYIASASSYEGFGLSIIEGLSSGLIPVLSPIAPFQKILKLLGFGFEIIPLTLPGSAAKIEDAHKYSKESYIEMRRDCIALAKKYAWPNVAEQFLSVYSQTLSASTRASVPLLNRHNK